MRQWERGGSDGQPRPRPPRGTDRRAERHVVARDIGGYAAEGKKEKDEEEEGAFLPSLPSDAWQNAGHKFTELELRTVGHFLISGSRKENTEPALACDIHPAAKKNRPRHSRQREKAKTEESRSMTETDAATMLTR